MPHRRYVLPALFSIVIPTLLVAHPPEPAPTWVSRTFWAMGTRLTVAVAADDRAHGLAAVEAVFRAVQETDATLSSWRADSEIGRLNAAPARTPVDASQALVSLLQEVRDWSARTGGAFDPAVGALIEVWDLRGTGRWPTPEELEDALARTGLGHLVVDDRAAALAWARDGAWLDAGAFGKGAALRNARAVLDSLEVRRALIDFGGQILALGGGDETLGSGVAVAHPARRGAPGLTLRVRDASVATSAQSERWVTAAGRRIGHIVDPRTGLPVPAWGSVTVVADDPLVADILSTALFVLGPDEAGAWAAHEPAIGVLVQELRGDEVAVRMNEPMRKYVHDPMEETR